MRGGVFDSAMIYSREENTEIAQTACLAGEVRVVQARRQSNNMRIVASELTLKPFDSHIRVLVCRKDPCSD